jgi:tetratricopeptide (TPR) repeat protein
LLREAVAHHQCGRLAEADQLYDTVLETDRSNADAWNLKAAIAQARDNHAQALSLIDFALAARPAFPEAHYNRALSLAALSRARDAIAAYDQALAQRADYADAYVNLALLYRGLGRRAEALATFRRMTETCPNDARAPYGLATELAATGDFRGAAAIFRQALTLKRDWPQAWNDLGSSCAALDDASGALDAFDRAISLDGGYQTPRANRGLILLSQGKLAAGWEGYRHRLSDPENPFSRNLSTTLPWPRWQGESLDGKRILLWNDHGVGDAILYANMIPAVMEGARACAIAVDPRLAPIFRRSFTGAEIVPLDQYAATFSPELAAQHFDYQSTFLDLGSVCRPDFSRFPNRRGVLKADLEAVAARRRKLQSEDRRLLVGISWHSANPVIGDEKSLKLGELLPLLLTAGCRFVNLQYGAASRDLMDAARAHQIPVIEPGVDCFTDLAGLAEVIAALDLVITVSNTTAHLAGALGVPTWLLVPTGRPLLWYWFRAGDFSPWYPSVRLFRKSLQRQEWAAVVHHMRPLLAAIPDC